MSGTILHSLVGTSSKKHQPGHLIVVGPTGSTGNDYTGTGTTDQTALQNACDILTSGGVLFLKRADYVTTAPVTLVSNLKIIAEPGTTITTSMTSSNNRGIFTISNKNNITIEGITFVANGGSTAVTSYGHDRLTFRDCGFTGTSTTSGAGILELCGQSSIGGAANMTNTTVQHCRFYDLTGTNARTIHIYPRNGNIVEKVNIYDCEFNNCGGPAIQLDTYDYCRGVKVWGNDFINVRQGSVVGGITDACAVHAGMANPNLVIGLDVWGNHYKNTSTSITEGGMVYFYGCIDVNIFGNICLGAWTGDYGVQGPCFAPGRTTNPSYNVNIHDNLVEGFNAFWDPDATINADVHDNTVRNCGGSLTLGYGVQKYVRIHHNKYYNCQNISYPSSYPAAIEIASSSHTKCEVSDNEWYDDNATPAISYFVEFTGNQDSSEVVMRNNRVYLANGAITTMLKKEQGSETLPRVFEGNEVHDSNGITKEFPNTIGNKGADFTISPSNGSIQTFTMTASLTLTISSGSYVGQTLELRITQDSTGSRVMTWPSNFKKAGGTLTLTTTANATDRILMRYDGTNWQEVSRSLNNS